MIRKFMGNISLFKIFVFMILIFVFLYFAYNYIFGITFLNSYYDLFGHISSDLKDSINWCANLDPYRSQIDQHMSFPYPPLIVLFYYIISIFVSPIEYTKDNIMITADSNYVLFYVVFTIIQVLIIAFCYSAIYKRYKKDVCCDSKTLFISIVFVISYPFLFALERGNSIVLTYMFLLIFLAYYGSDNKITNEVSLIALAISANIKLYPVFYGLLLLKKNNTRDIVKAIVYGIILFLVPFFFLKGGFLNSFNAFLTEFTAYNSTDGLYHNLSLMGIVYTLFSKYSFISWKMVYYILLLIACPIIILNTIFDKKTYNKLLFIYLLILCLGRVGRYVHAFCFIPIIYILCMEDKVNKENLFVLIMCIIFSIYYQLLKFNLFIILYMTLLFLVLYTLFKFINVVENLVLRVKK